jgi:hypothetical protein
MKENKYYIPEIENIRVGFEGEALLPSTDEWHCDTWTKFQIDPDKVSNYSPWNGEGTHIDEVLNKIRLKEIRVLFLTKEDIESDGWTFSELVSLEDKDILMFSKKCDTIEGIDKVYMYYSAKSNWLLIYTGGFVIKQSIDKNEITTNNTLFAGTCRCRNDLKLIEKLINI